MATIDPSPQRYVKDPNVQHTCLSCKGTVVTTDCEVSRQREENARLKAQLEAAERMMLRANQCVEVIKNRGERRHLAYDYLEEELAEYEKLKAGAGSAVRKDVQVIHGGGSASLIKRNPDCPAVPVELKAGKQESSPALPKPADIKLKKGDLK